MMLLFSGGVFFYRAADGVLLNGDAIRPAAFSFTSDITKRMNNNNSGYSTYNN